MHSIFDCGVLHLHRLKEIMQPNQEVKKAWNPVWIAVIGFFFTLLPALVLMALNYERMGKAAYKWPLIILSVLMFLGLALLTTLLSGEYDWIFAVIHLGGCVAIAAIQKPMYESFLDASELHQAERFTLPVLYSFIFVISFLGIFSAYQYWQYHKIKNVLQQAEQYFLEGRGQEAINILNQINQSQPKDKTVLYNLSLIYLNENKPDSARIFLRQLLAQHPEDDDARALLYQANFGEQ
jgi:tetratricopeptide (TPR) repeat protein